MTQLPAAIQWQAPGGARERVHWASESCVSTVALTRTGGATINNTIQVIGYAGQNPHAISFGDTGNKVVKFSVAVKEFSANSEENKTVWIDYDAWNGLGDRVLKSVTKGREILVQGRLALSTFKKEVNGEKLK